MNENYTFGEIIEIIGFDSPVLILDAASNRQKLNVVTMDGEHLTINNSVIFKIGKRITNNIFKNSLEFCDNDDMSVGCLFRDSSNELCMIVAFSNNNFASIYQFKNQKYINGFLYKGALTPLGCKVNFNKLMYLISQSNLLDI